MARIWYRRMIARLRIVTARAAHVPAGRKMTLAGDTINRMEVTMRQITRQRPRPPRYPAPSDPPTASERIARTWFPSE